MRKAEYKEWMRRARTMRASNAKALLWCTYILTWTSLSLLLSTATQYFALYVLAQISFGVSLLSCFCVLHDLGHNRFFRTRIFNDIFGLIFSVITIIPFYSWREIHSAHHLWAGWIDRDPTCEQIHQGAGPLWRRRLIDFCWKFWIPAFTAGFALRNFWNYSRLKKFFPKNSWRFLISIALPLVFHGFLILYFGKTYFIHYGPAFLVYMLLCDPLLLSQHGHIHQDEAAHNHVHPKALYEQAQHTRSLRTPNFISRYILIHFDHHVAHHLFPWIPGYDLNKIPRELFSDYEENWWDWLKQAKSMPGSVYLFEASVPADSTNKVS